MNIQQTINKAENLKAKPSYFEILNANGEVIVSRTPYEASVLESQLNNLSEKQVTVQFKKWHGQSVRNYFPVPVELNNPDSIPAFTGGGSGLSGMSSLHEWAYTQEKEKATELKSENKRLSTELEAKRDKVIELERKIEKMQSDFQIERMQEEGERSSGLNGILNKASENPELLMGFLQSLPETIRALGELGKKESTASQSQISQGNSSAELQVQHTAQQIAQWFMTQLKPEEQKSFVQMFQLMVKEHHENELSYLEIFHNLKDLFNDDESNQANG